MQQTTFASMALSKSMQENLQKVGYNAPTPIQQEVIPAVLAHKDIIAQAKTGSGKTASYAIPLLQKLDVKNFHIQTLILTPTRELAQQVAQELRLLAKFQHNVKILTLCGGVAFYPQEKSLRHSAHIVVATPKRLIRHLEKNTIELDSLEHFVLDEADKMLDMGFMEQILEIHSFLKKDIQTLLFSATYPPNIQQLSQTLQKEPLFIETLSTQTQNSIEQKFYKTQEKLQTLLNALYSFHKEKTIIFCNTKVEATNLAQTLREEKIDALAIHGDLEQYERDDVLIQFINESCPILVATDLAARGIDIDGVELVINYDNALSYDTYMHRIGRTARNGKEGCSVTLIENEKDLEIFPDEIKFEQFGDIQRKIIEPKNTTIVIEGGKKNKLHAGDIVGVLTKTLQKEDIGKIMVNAKQTYVAVVTSKVDDAMECLRQNSIKKKRFGAWILK